MRKSRLGIFAAALTGLVAISASPPAAAQDFLSALFGALTGGNSAPQMPRLGYGSEPEVQFPPRQSGHVSGGSQTAYCVRTCDGRYFPAPPSDRQSRADACNNFCPASETKVFFGRAIDNAVTDGGKSYADLPNAFKYRTEMVAGCSCNGKDSTGLASVNIENDKTLRKGDIVAGADGLLVANKGADRRGASLNFSPASPAIQKKYDRLPVMASD